MPNAFFEKLEINDYRLCQSCGFQPNSTLNALIGPNSSGKTTILRAINLLKHALQERIPFQDETERTVEPTRIKAWINIEGHTIQHTVNLMIYTDEDNDDNIVRSDHRWNLQDITGNPKSFSMPLALATPMMRHYYVQDSGRFFGPEGIDKTISMEIFNNESIMSILRQVGEFYNQITYYSASVFTNPSNCPVSFEIDQDNKPTARRLLTAGHGKWLFDMWVEQIEDTTEYHEYEDVIGPNGLNLIDHLEFEEVALSSIEARVRIGGRLQKKDKQTKLVIPKFYKGKNVVSPTQLSEGTFKTLAMLFYLMTGKSKVVLLEEPEVCIHHGLLSALIELIKQYSREKQVFISTHSDHILDELNQENVFVVSNNPMLGITVKPLIKWIPKGDINALKEFLGSTGTLGEYWHSGGFDDTFQS